MSSVLYMTKNWRKLKDLMGGNLIPTYIFFKEFLNLLSLISIQISLKNLLIIQYYVVPFRLIFIMGSILVTFF